MGESIACMIDSSNDVEKKTNEKLIGENIYLILIKRRKKCAPVERSFVFVVVVFELTRFDHAVH